MKREICLGLLLFAVPAGYAQETTQPAVTTTTKPAAAQQKVTEQKTRTVVEPSQVEGNVASVDPGDSTLLLSVPGNPTPLRFYFGDETTFVDASGDPLTQDALKLGLGVRLDYVKAGDKLVITKAHLQPMGAVEKIDVQPGATEKTITLPAATPVIEQTTTTTTPE
jgi:hypothetical protein